MPAPFDRGDPEAIQERIRQRRARLLGGFGPGADDARIAAAQRDRPSLGALPPPVERQQVADQATLARGEPEQIEHVAVRDAGRLADAIRTIYAHRTVAVSRLRRTLLTTSVGALTGALLTIAWQRRSGSKNRARRARDHPRGLPPAPARPTNGLSS